MTAIRSFDGVNDGIELGKGAVNGTGALSVAVLCSRGRDASVDYVFSYSDAATGGKSGLGFEADNSVRWEDGTVGGAWSASVKLTVAEGLAILVVTKAAGSTVPRFHKKLLSGGGWVHSDGWRAVANAAASTRLEIGNWNTVSNFFLGKVAVAAAWDSVLSDANVESLFATSATADWLALNPAGLWQLNQLSGATQVPDDTDGGADQNGGSGSTAADVAFTWTYYIPPPPDPPAEPVFRERGGGAFALHGRKARGGGVWVPSSAGRVEGNRFSGEMKSGTEALLENPANRAAILARYQRLLVYYPYFDQHLSWFPGTRCWAYHNLIRTQDLSMPRVDYMNAFGPGDVETWWAADIREPAWQEYWIEEALDLYGRGYRGLRLDDINPDEPLEDSGGTPYTPAWWVEANADFLELIRESLPSDMELLGNVSRWWMWGLADRTVTMPHLLRIIDALDLVEMERGFNDPGLSSGHRTTLLNDWHGLMKDRGKGWSHFVQHDVVAPSTGLDYALGWFDDVNELHYAGEPTPGWIMTSAAVDGMSWPDAVGPGRP